MSFALVFYSVSCFPELSVCQSLLKLGAEIYPANGDLSGGRLGFAVQRATMMHNIELLKVLLNATKCRDAQKLGPLLLWVLNTKTVNTFERIVFSGPEIERNLQELIVLALKYEKNIEKINTYAENALFFSVAKGNARMTQFLLGTKCRAQLDVPSGRYALCPLLLAVSLNAEDQVETLLRAGANINSTFGGLDETCFHMCSRKSGSIRIAELLFKYCKGSATEKIQFLGRPRKDRRSSYHLAVYQGHFKLADWYAAEGVNVEAALDIITWNFRGIFEIFPSICRRALTLESKPSAT